MKKSTKLIITLLVVLIVIASVLILIKSSNLLQGPESVAFDATAQRFLISSVLNKSIVSMSLDGRYTSFLRKGLSAPRGIIIKDGTLFVADQTKIQIIDLASAQTTDTIPIEGAKMLNDIAMDKQGIIYVTDTNANCVWLVKPGTKTIDKVVSPLLKAPNGIIYDMPRNQMFIVGFTSRSPILSLSTSDRSVSIFMDTIYSDLDGIAIDDLGRIYISSWAQDMIFEIPQEQNRFIAKFKDIRDAGDMFYYLPGNELIVPLFTQNKVIRIPLD